MRLRSVLLSILSGFLLGCSAPLYFYPVKSPMPDQMPVQVIKGSVNGISLGNIQVVLPDGELCRGAWSPVGPDQVRMGSQPLERTGPPTLASAWDAVFGAGYYLSHVLGSKMHVRAVLQGNHGTRIDVEAYRDTVPGSPLLGVALDSRGNLFKVAL